MYALIVFLPLIGFLIAGLGARLIGDRGAQIVTCGLLLLAAVLSWIAFFDIAVGGNPSTYQLFSWIESGDLDIGWALRMDSLTAVMLIVVNTVSALVHVYSVGYMAHDHSIPRFMAYLSLFTFAMLMLVTADNLVQLFFGWEGVGLASYLLIGFWYDRPSANAAAIKAFVVNRIGDFAFVLGIAGIFLVFDTVQLSEIFERAPEFSEASFAFLGAEVHAMTALCVLLFVGAMGKSAQLGLHTWLPDAMEGPTPVSALIHAATMVTAGVFLVCRMSPLYELAPDALTMVAIVGAATAVFAATVGLVQNDIKRVIAYSTCSQLGYMFFAAGVSAYPAAMFHLTTHAFFKALLFLGAGAIIHAMSDEQDMRKMGGIWRLVPVTYTLMWIGSLALAGIGIPFLDIGFAGFYSKDLILESAYGAHSGVGSFAFWMGIFAAAMTAFYSWRLLFMTFHGRPRADDKVMAHVHEAPLVMTVPLVLLAVGAVASGFALYPWLVGDGMVAFWGESLAIEASEHAIEAAHHAPGWVKLLPIIVSVAGIGLAWLMYIAAPRLAPALAVRTRPIYLFLLNKWYFDELYDRVFVRPAFFIGHGLWKTGDGAIIDGCGPDGLARASRDIARRASALQSGFVYHYAFAMLIGVVVLVTWYLYGAA